MSRFNSSPSTYCTYTISTDSPATVVVSSSCIANWTSLSFSCNCFLQFSAILSILSLTVLLESGTDLTFSAACGPHSPSTILMQAGLINSSPILCGFFALAINSEHSKETLVAFCKSLPALSNTVLMSDLFDRAISFFLSKNSLSLPIVSGCFVSWCLFILLGFMLSFASFSPQKTHSGRDLSWPSIKPKCIQVHHRAENCYLNVLGMSPQGKLEDRKPLMVLFDDVAMHYILSAAQPVGAGVVETHYTFLKRLCQVLCALGSQLCSLVGSDVEVEVPANLSKYTEAFLAFTTHPSQFLRSSTQITWGTLFRHEILSKDPVIIQMTIKYFRATMTNLVKTGFPSSNDSPSCEYSRHDFDSDEDFNSFFNCNSFLLITTLMLGEVVRNACRIVPLEAFQIAAEWLQYQISTPIDIGTTVCTCSKTAEGLCSILSPSEVQWDAMTFFTESVVGKIFKNVEDEKLPVDQGIELLQAVLNYNTRDPLILSCVLTNVSVLFPFVTHRPHFLPQVLYKLFAAITFEVVEESKAPRTRAVKNIRRHACSSIIKMSRDYPQFILPCFDMMYNHVKKLFSSEALLNLLEKCALMEALVLISNQFKDYNKQKNFLEELMATVTARWTSDEMRQYVHARTHTLSTQNCLHTLFCVYTILGVVKRARWPADLEEAKAGGFVVGYAPNGAPIFRNPCNAQVLALLQCVCDEDGDEDDIVFFDNGGVCDYGVCDNDGVVGGNLLPEAVTWFYTSVLKGLQMHGQHEICNSALTQLALLMYENLRPRYMELRDVMTQIPDINLEALDQYDQRLLEPSSAQRLGEKKRKDQFKKLIAGTVGKALAQQFKKEVHIRNLPSLFKKPKPEKRDILETSESGALAALFSPALDDI
uniref:Exportin 5 n=1 Tax=Hucho hucho TaxID=62062 RepID=A0A4W5NG36_9TELE